MNWVETVLSLVFGRRRTHVSLEGLREGEGITVANSIGNVLDRVKTLFEHFTCLLHAVRK